MIIENMLAIGCKLCADIVNAFLKSLDAVDCLLKLIIFAPKLAPLRLPSISTHCNLLDERSRDCAAFHVDNLQATF